MHSKILLIEDDVATRFGYSRFLTSLGYEVDESGGLISARQLFAAERYDAVIVDIHLPDGSGLDAIATFKKECPEVAIIVITGVGDVPQAVEAMRRGADNYLIKPVDMHGLELFLQKNLEVGAIKKLHATQQRLRRREEIWFGTSATMRSIEHLVHIAANSNAPVLITGETGTGKGIIAQWIHRHGTRAPYELVDVNCSGLKGDLLARELFGNVRGAFTSADKDRDGLLDAADRGTLFLDEIGEMDPTVQAQFLKVLEEKTYRRLGDTKRRKSDFRLICATNRLIEDEIGAGHFRRDLYYRINILELHVPPLRERPEDIPDLIRYILANNHAAKADITDDAMQCLQSYLWPGNVRELKNVLERATLLAPGALLTCEHFSWLQTPPQQPISNSQIKTLGELEQEHIRNVLALCNEDVSKAAKQLGISRATLYRKLKETIA